MNTEETSVETTGEQIQSRRDALRKGGTAAAVVAGAWTVPVITGMGVSPAGAAACSATNTVNVSGTASANTIFGPFSSDNGGWGDSAAWKGDIMGPNVVPVAVAGGTATINVSAKQPQGNIDNPCFHTVASVAGVPSATWAPPPSTTVCSDSVVTSVACNVTLMDVLSCPPVGIANDNACWRVGAGGCSVATNGSASGQVTVNCTVTVTGSYEAEA